MSYNINDRLSKIIFIELKDLSVLQKINSSLYKELQGKDVLFPVDLKIAMDIDNVKRSELTMDKFFIGMLLCIGGNSSFKYNSYYEDIILGFQGSEEFFKGYIYKLVSKNELFETYILLKGLSSIYVNFDYIEKLIDVLYNLKDEDDYLSNELDKHIEYCIKKYKNLKFPYMYKSMIQRDCGDYVLAIDSIDKYIEKSNGDVKNEIHVYRSQLLSFKSYEEGKEKIYSSPKEAVNILLNIIEEFKDDALIYYYIGIGYRKLGLYDYAISYLKKSREIDSDIVEVVNELGLNYASLNYYDDALKYFLKVFQVTNAVEVCTNIIMCYYRLNDKKNIEKYFEIAKTINKNDEILIELDKFIQKKR